MVVVEGRDGRSRVRRRKKTNANVQCHSCDEITRGWASRNVIVFSYKGVRDGRPWAAREQWGAPTCTIHRKSTTPRRRLESEHEEVYLLRNLSRRRMTRRTKWEGVAIYGHLVLCRPGGEAHGRGDARYFLAPGLWPWGPTFRPCTRDVFCPLADPHRAHTARIPVDS